MSINPIAAEILPAVAKAYGITVEKLLSRDRLSLECAARKVAAFLLHQHAGFCCRDVSITLKRGAGCSNMIRSWIDDVNVLTHLKAQAKKIQAELLASRGDSSLSLTSGPVFSTSVPHTPRGVIATNGKTLFVAYYDGGFWYNAHTFELIDSRIIAWQELADISSLKPIQPNA